MEVLKDIIEMAKQYGVIGAGWILVFGGVVWVAGHGGKMALKNVKELLDASDKLRLSMQDQLDRANQSERETDMQNRRLVIENADLRASIDQMRRDMERAAARADRIERDNQDAQVRIRTLTEELRSLSARLT
jgi:septal ring factor EnvC (AmiA/AmiB activator)